jgi:hypothetical protein
VTGRRVEVDALENLHVALRRLEDSHRDLVDEVRRLRAWKAEALEVMTGLQELGRELGVPLGAQVTGEQALVAARRLRTERDVLLQTLTELEPVRLADRAELSSTDVAQAVAAAAVTACPDPEGHCPSGDDHRPGHSVFNGETRWCEACYRHQQACGEDHCMVCGSST